MKKTSQLLVLSLAFTLSCTRNEVSKGPASPFDKIAAIEETFKVLPINEIKPQGWLREQLRENVEGFTGNLDQLVPDLIIKDDIYGTDRLTKKVKSKDVGALGEAGDWQVQFLWWNSETQSNWRDGYIRTAILLNDTAHLERLEQYVNKILSTQDSDGYIGIYDEELRYKFNNENGELWAKSSLLRGLLAWYEYKQDRKLLDAIERAAKNVMENYPAGSSHPFQSKQPNVGGTSHGLTITDVFESLFRITGNSAYRDYCIFLYKDFSEQVLNEDAQYKKLVNDTLALSGHGVHTYEHLRSLAAAYYASGNPELKTAIDKFLDKINVETSASGGGVGDEWIGGKKADATSRGYEYCSLHELMHSYIELFVKSGEHIYADLAEKIFFNAAQGARHPEESCIAYLKSDNSYAMTGGLNGDASNEKQTRYKYSPVHQDAAVCCVPNAGRITPYYVTSMWMKNDHAIVASLLGPGEVTTNIGDQKITIVEETKYPFENSIQFKVTGEGTFDLLIRKPSWVKNFTLSEAYQDQKGFIVIHKNWTGTQNVKVEFLPEVEVRRDINNEVYFTYGALVLAKPLQAVEEKSKAHPLPGFFDLKYKTTGALVVHEYCAEPVAKDADKLVFQTEMINPATKQKEPVTLIPLGETILRQVTFKEQ